MRPRVPTLVAPEPFLRPRIGYRVGRADVPPRTTSTVDALNARRPTSR
jgi:hypothetical protein